MWGDDYIPVITLEAWQRRRADRAKRANPSNNRLPDRWPEDAQGKPGPKPGSKRRDYVTRTRVVNGREEVLCLRCNCWLTADQFWRRSGTKLYSRCRTCASIEWKRNNQLRKTGAA
jgi:hypothetical protein